MVMKFAGLDRRLILTNEQEKDLSFKREMSLETLMTKAVTVDN